MKTDKNNTDKVIINSFDQIIWNNVKIVTMLNTSYSSGAPEHLRRNVKLTFVLDGESPELNTYVKERLASSLRIKANTPKDVLKGAEGVYDNKSYVEYLDKHDCKFEFDVIDLQAFKRGSTIDPTVTFMENLPKMQQADIISFIDTQIEPIHGKVYADTLRKAFVK